MKSKLLIGILFLSSTFLAHAQNEVDALRYSQPFINGTARFNSMGGAFTALGGDMTSINQNPAGLAVYRSNEIYTGLNLFSQTTRSSYLNNGTSNNQINLNIPNFGLLFYNKIDDSDYGWVSSYFA
ncbi:MAG: hypothetical protein IT237_14075, partial [Bacteroidia bacterium]|nr:hypothetical protein [Bacteroidia bacterium]